MSPAKGYRRWEREPSPPPPPPRRLLAVRSVLRLAGLIAGLAGLAVLAWNLASHVGAQKSAAPATAAQPQPPVAAEQPAAPPSAAPRRPRDWARASNWSELELAIWTETNRARTRPAEYQTLAEQRAKSFVGLGIRKSAHVILQTQEGAPAAWEAVEFLKRQAPLPPLDTAQGLHLAAADHVREQGPRGATGHESADGTTTDQRIDRHGEWLETMGENIAYGSETGEDVVLGLIVDDGVPSRGHRANICSPDLKLVGVACGPHAIYRIECVMDYAGGFADP